MSERTLVRNGPARFEVGDRTLNHWFDGLARLHAFGFEDGRVSYANRYLDTGAHRAAARRADRGSRPRSDVGWIWSHSETE